MKVLSPRNPNPVSPLCSPSGAGHWCSLQPPQQPATIFLPSTVSCAAHLGHHLSSPLSVSFCLLVSAIATTLFNLGSGFISHSPSTVLPLPTIMAGLLQRWPLGRQSLFLLAILPSSSLSSCLSLLGGPSAVPSCYWTGSSDIIQCLGLVG